MEVRRGVEQAGLGSCLLPLMWEQRNPGEKELKNLLPIKSNVRSRRQTWRQKFGL